MGSVAFSVSDPDSSVRPISHVWGHEWGTLRSGRVDAPARHQLPQEAATRPGPIDELPGVYRADNGAPGLPLRNCSTSGLAAAATA
jgi:hypothetical protein